MALRARAFSTNSSENQLGNPLGGKRGLNSGNIRATFSFLVKKKKFSGTSNLQRAALGEIKNIANSRHNSVSTDEPSKDFKEPLKPLVTRRLVTSMNTHGYVNATPFSEMPRRRKIPVSLYCSCQRMNSRTTKSKSWIHHHRPLKMCKWSTQTLKTLMPRTQGTLSWLLSMSMTSTAIFGKAPAEIKCILNCFFQPPRVCTECEG